MKPIFIVLLLISMYSIQIVPISNKNQSKARRIPIRSSRPAIASLLTALALDSSSASAPYPETSLASSTSFIPWKLLTYIPALKDGSSTQGHHTVGEELPSACQGQMQTHKARSGKPSHLREPCLGLPTAGYFWISHFSFDSILKTQGPMLSQPGHPIQQVLLFSLTPEAQGAPSIE